LLKRVRLPLLADEQRLLWLLVQVDRYPCVMFTMFRRAVFGATIAGLTAAILRVFGGDGGAPQSGGWREVDPNELNQ